MKFNVIKFGNISKISTPQLHQSFDNNYQAIQLVDVLRKVNFI